MRRNRPTEVQRFCLGLACGALALSNWAANSFVDFLTKGLSDLEDNGSNRLYKVYGMKEPKPFIINEELK